MTKKNQSFLKELMNSPEAYFPYAILAMLGYAFYNIALRFVPVDFDDLVLLSVVKNTRNPITFFASDWGFGNYGYRPLHSLSLWLSYQIFGVSSGPAQLINILLHISVILLLYALLVKLLSSKRWTIAFALACVGMISLYTVSPPTWVSDRPTLLVTIFLLILLNYFAHIKEDEQPKCWVLGVLSVLAVMSKESGLIIPLVSLYYVMFEAKSKTGKTQNIVVTGAVLILYGLLRFVLFGANAATYTESGYLFGLNYYENLGVLTGGSRVLAYLDNVIKNILAVFLPILDGQGKISLLGTKLNSLVVVACTVGLFILSLGKKLTRFQRVSLVIILLNGLIHMQLFRYRTLYIPALAFLIFIAASEFLRNGKGEFRRFVVLALAILFVLWNMHMIGENLDFELMDRLILLRQATFEEDILATSNVIDPDIIREIISKYRH